MSEQLDKSNTDDDVQDVAAASTTVSTLMSQPVTLLDEEALAEQSKKLPFILSSNRKQQHQHSLSNSSSFDGDIATNSNTTDIVIENEYGQMPPGRIHGIHKKGTPTQHRILHGMTTTSSTGSVDGGGSDSSSVNQQLLSDELIKTPTTTRKTLASNTSRSRSCSPSIGRSGGAVSATITTTVGSMMNANSSTIPTLMHSVMTDGNSSISSMDDYECDLYTDRAGIMDDLSESQRKLHSSKDLHLPSTVLERMCEDSLEDNHAFTDVVVGGRSRRTINSSTDRDRSGDESGTFSSNASRVSHVSGSNAGDGMLEPLDECDEGLENDSLEDSVTDQQNYGLDGFGTIGAIGGTMNEAGSGNGNNIDSQQSQQQQTVILTNMENLTLESANNKQFEAGYSSQAGSVSFIESSVGGVAAGTTSNAGDISETK